ncbi:MAG TPA: hypothetical protein VJA94_03245 [Candidatus Angelobacter sp.]
MRKAIAFALFALLLTSMADATGLPCPVILVSGAGEADAFTITFMNRGKLPIRRIEFNCGPARGKVRKADQNHCIERNADFLPGNQFTVRYTYPGGKPSTMIVSLRSITLGDGHEWKPTKAYNCRTLRIQAKK